MGWGWVGHTGLQGTEGRARDGARGGSEGGGKGRKEK